MVDNRNTNAGKPSSSHPFPSGKLLNIEDTVAPVDPSEHKFVEVCTHSRRVLTFNAEGANRVVHYLLRWVNDKGDTTLWSQPVSGTIPAIRAALSDQ